MNECLCVGSELARCVHYWIIGHLWEGDEVETEVGRRKVLWGTWLAK